MKKNNIHQSSNLNIKNDILLLNPPFAPAGNPYIAIPVLAAYLKSKNIHVDAFDLNREFFFRLLTPRRILEGMDYCMDRLHQLNGKPRLDFLQIAEMRCIVYILSKYSFYQDELKMLSRPSADFNDVSRSNAKHLFSFAATMPNFPEFIQTSPVTAAMTKFNAGSSKDILDNIDRSDFYSETLREIIREELKDRLPRCVGISVPYSQQIMPAFQCAKTIKEISPETHVTMGGPCISIFFRKTEVKAFFDIVDSFIMDEGEIPLEILIRELSKVKPALENVPGLVYMSGSRLRKNPPPPPVDVENAPPPDYTIFQLNKYLNPIDKMMLTFRLSRGCYWKRCAFCRTELPMTRDFQQIGRDIVYKHLVHIAEQTGVRSFFFSDDTSHPAVLEYISKRLKRDNIKITWKAHTRVSDHLTHERCQQFKDSGCTQLSLGVESFTDRILKKMQKGITTTMIHKTLKEINGVIPVYAYMIMGFPSEEEAECKEGFKKIRRYQAAGLLTGYFYNVFTMVYGSDIWESPEKYGISDIRGPRGQDLLADICDFECEGMKRKRVYQLFRKINGVDELIKSLNRDELTINDQVITLRYDLTKTQQTEQENYSFLYLPFVQWLKQTNEMYTPLTPCK